MAELLRPELSRSIVADLALYILLRLAQRGESIVDDEKLVKLLFFALYTEPDPRGKPVLRSSPPRLTPEMEFRIYLRGPYMRVRRLAESINKSSRRLLGLEEAVAVSILKDKIIITSKVRESLVHLTGTLRELLSRKLERIYGPEYMDVIDKWVVEYLGSMSTSDLEKLSLQVLHLDVKGPPVRKAMVFNMSLDDYVELLRELERIRRDYETGRLSPDYDPGSLEDIEEEG